MQCRTRVSGSRRVAGVILAAGLLTALLLTGCISDANPVRFSEQPRGTINVSQRLTSVNVTPQKLQEYGVFYSTNRADIVAVAGSENVMAVASFTVNPAVAKRTITIPALNQFIPANRSGALAISAPGLSPGTTYYFRLYTVGLLDGEPSLLAYQVASYTTLPSGLSTKPLAGDNRYDTAIDISKEGFPSGATDVVIATGENWPDALGGAALAGVLDCPILLTPKGTLPAAVGAEITRLGASKAYILGGPSAVSDTVKTALATKLGGTTKVERISGANRYETANAIAARTITLLGDDYEGTAFIATGTNFPDALGASPLAAAKGWPIYLANPAQSDNAALITTMKAKGVKYALILGGSDVVASSIQSKAQDLLVTVTRLEGHDRYQTAVAVAKHGVDYAGMNWGKVAIATGSNFPDALAGGVLQGRDNTVMLLTPGTSLNAAVRTTLTANKATIYRVRYLGGTNAVNTSVRTAVGQALQ